MSWVKKFLGKSGVETERLELTLNAEMAEIKSVGKVASGHYTDSVEKITALKREGRNSEAIELLLQCVDATESEARLANSKSLAVKSKFSVLDEGRANPSWGVAPWYYEQLAILYRREKQYQKEVEILERYCRQEKAPGSRAEKLILRLVQARELAEKS